jgi:hypothetical protein
MSTLVAVRVPDELLAKVDAKGKRSPVIIAALEAYLGGAHGVVRSNSVLTNGRIGSVSDTVAVVQSLPKPIRPAVTVAARLANARPAHDPETCKVYGCGMCQAAKTG